MIMITLKSITIVAALLAGGTSLAIAQNGLPTGGDPPVAGGAAGNPIINPGYYGGYYVTGGYIAAPGYVVPGRVMPGYAEPVAQPGYVGAEEPAGPTVVVTHHRSMYMYVPPHRSGHRTQKIAPAANE
jgi:hypothetical protein